MPTEEASLRARIAELEAALVEAEAAITALRERDARELATAHRIQVSLLPRAFPELEGWRFAARYRAAREIGGDLYDAYASHPDRPGGLGLSIADVTGKGVTAALLMAFCRAVMRAAAWNGTGPADTLTRVNRVLARDVRSGLFVTALVAEVEGDGIRWSSAGHEPPLLVSPLGPVTELSAGAMMLGLFDDTTFPEYEGVLEPGETFLMLTDGVTDALDGRGRRFGDARLRRALHDLRHEDADAIVRGLLERVDAFAGGVDQTDDLAIVAVQRVAR